MRANAMTKTPFPSRPRSRWARRLAIASGAALALLALALLVIKLFYGGGRPYPGVTGTPMVAAHEVEVAASLQLPLGNVAVSDQGRVFFNIHPFAQAHRFQDAFVFELVDGTPVPFPSAELQPELQFTFGMTTDRQGRLWLTSPATSERAQTRVVAIDLATGHVVVDHLFEPGVARGAQDLRVSADGRTMYMADTGTLRFTEAALLVVDLDSWAVRRVLAGHPSTQPQDWYIQTAHGPNRVAGGLITFAIGVDGIALDPEGKWLYYATMTHDTLYRIPTSVLLDGSLEPEAVASAVQAVGPKPLSDGIATDAAGRVLVTDVEHGALVRMTPAGKLETLMVHPDIVWSDGVSVAPNGDVYVTDSAIPSYLDPWLRPPSRAALDRGAPYGLYRLRANTMSATP